MKKALKGLRGISVFPVTENTESSYKVGEALPMPAAQELTKDDQREDWDIPADDSTYATGSDYKYTDLEVTVAELTNEMDAKLSGGTYDQENDTYTARDTDTAIEVALAYAAVNIAGGYRLFRHYVAKVMKISVSHKTKGDGKEIASYKLSLRSTARKIDGAYRDQRDVAKGDALSWIKVIEAMPIASGG